MPAPSRIGYSAGTNTGAATVAITNPTGAQAGDRIIAMLSEVNSTVSIADLAGWTLLDDVTFNTRRWFLIEREYASSYAPIGLSSAMGIIWAAMAIRPTSGYTLQPTIEGAHWRRVDNGGSINYTHAPSVDAPANSLALALFSETSTGPEVEAGATLSGAPGWAKWFWSKASAGDADPINYVAFLELEAAGASGVPIVTYIRSDTSAPANSNNGIGKQLIIPQASASVPTTGLVGAHGVFGFDQDYLSIGTQKLGGTLHEAAIFLSGTELVRNAITHSTAGWGSTTFPGLSAGTEYVVKFYVDGALQTDAQITATTMPLGPANFVFTAGTCQFTGSDHPIFDRMRETDALFVSHMGDLHYQDATDLAGWRAGVIASLSSPRMKAMLEAVPMPYTYDNHDVVRTDPLGGPSVGTAAAWKELASYEGWSSTGTLGRAWTAGRVRFIQTDQRSVRDNYNSVPDGTMWGASQKTWFKNQLTAAAAEIAAGDIALVVWLSGWTARNDASGRWNSYPSETSELEAHIASLGLTPKMVMIGGDSHVLQADDGSRTGAVWRFHGIPSLNMSGFNRSSQYATGGWSIAEADLRTAGQAEADWGGYSRVSIVDDGDTVTLGWEGVRVDAAGVEDVMASWSQDFSPSDATELIRLGSATPIGFRLGSATPIAIHLGVQQVWGG